MGGASAPIAPSLGSLLEQLMTVHNNISKSKRKWKEIDPELRKGSVKKCKCKCSCGANAKAAAAGPTPSGLVPLVAAAAPNQEPQKPWWLQYKLVDVVALDTEMVHLKPEYCQKCEPTLVTGEDRVKAATVSRSVNQFIEVYSAKIYWPAGSFRVNKHTRRINGFNKNSLQNGRSLAAVKEEIRKVLKDKLVITCNGAADFRALGQAGGAGME